MNTVSFPIKQQAYKKIKLPRASSLLLVLLLCVQQDLYEGAPRALMFTSDTQDYDDNLVSLKPVVTVDIPIPHLQSEIKRPTGFLISAVSKRVDVLHFSVVENQLHVICRDDEAKKAVQWTLDKRIRHPNHATEG